MKYKSGSLHPTTRRTRVDLLPHQLFGCQKNERSTKSLPNPPLRSELGGVAAYRKVYERNSQWTKTSVSIALQIRRACGKGVSCDFTLTHQVRSSRTIPSYAAISRSNRDHMSRICGPGFMECQIGTVISTPADCLGETYSASKYLVSHLS